MRQAVRIAALGLTSCLAAGTASAQERGGGSLWCLAGLARQALRIADACRLSVPEPAIRRLLRVQAAYLGAEERLNGAQARADADVSLQTTSRPPPSPEQCREPLRFAAAFIDELSTERGERFTQMLEAEARSTTDPRAGACL
jgi:hypothetical protein